jgi:hypothetical protein
MKYFQIFYPYKKEIEVTKWRIFYNTVLVEAKDFESACEKIKNIPKHQYDKFYDFIDLTIR